MESVIREVKDIEGDKREWLEAALQEHLAENQRVLIVVLSPDAPADEVIRQRAMAHLGQLSQEGAAHRRQLGVSDEEADQVLDEAIRHVRQHKSE
jgi:hypothetical protein